jgi:hypothetical protein
MRTRTNRDSRPGRPRPAPERRPDSAPSTAWLEAQAAFSAPAAAEAPAPAVGPVPVVVLRRGRPLEGLADRSAAPGSEATEADTARPARVFRVVSAPAPTPEAAVALAAASLEAPRRPRPRRTRRSQQAPGVATVISFAPPPGAVLPYREQMARLGELMRAIDEALAVAQQARSFELTLP